MSSITLVAGVVDRYFADKGYGFIVVQGHAKPVFFHLTRRQPLLGVSGCKKLEDLQHQSKERIPLVGDLLVFELKEKPQGIQAEPWNFANSAAPAPKFRVHRIVKIGDRKPEHYTMWEGSCLSELNEKFARFEGHDQLAPITRDEYSKTFVFERLDPGQKDWIKVPDPRVVVTRPPRTGPRKRAHFNG